MKGWETSISVLDLDPFLSHHYLAFPKANTQVSSEASVCTGQPTDSRPSLSPCLKFRTPFSICLPLLLSDCFPPTVFGNFEVLLLCSIFYTPCCLAPRRDHRPERLLLRGRRPGHRLPRPHQCPRPTRRPNPGRDCSAASLECVGNRPPSPVLYSPTWLQPTSRALRGGGR